MANNRRHLLLTLSMILPLFLLVLHLIPYPSDAAPGLMPQTGLNAAQPAIDPENPRKLVRIQPDGSIEPFHFIGRTAYMLLDPNVDGELYINECAAMGVNSLRIFMMIDWRAHLSPKWCVNPWVPFPGAPMESGDPDTYWWEEFDDGPGGYWERLDRCLDLMAQKKMTALICMFDHGTLARLETEFPGEGTPFLTRPGTADDDGRLDAFLNRTVKCLKHHPNVIIEIGNQITGAWYHPGKVLGTRASVKMAAQKDDDLNCALWMYDVANILKTKFSAGEAPLITNSSAYLSDRFFELTLVDGWNNPVSYCSPRLENWDTWSWNALTGPPRENSGLRNRYPFPFIDVEPMKFGSRNSFNLSDDGPARFRRLAWVTAMAGGYHTYHSVWSITCVPDSQLTPQQYSGGEYLRFYAEFWTKSRRPVDDLEPDPLLIDEISDQSLKTFPATTQNHAFAAVYLVSDESPGDTSVVLNMRNKNITATVCDPVSGEEIWVPVIFENEKPRVHIPASAWNHSDLILILE